MRARYLFMALGMGVACTLGSSLVLNAQSAAPPRSDNRPGVKKWRTPQGGARTARNAITAPAPRSTATANPPDQGSATPPADSQLPADNGPVTRAKVSEGSGALPNDHGQIWREYDITPYTVRATATARPEQAIIDWILRETGYEAWHSEPLGLLSANRRSIKVYHTPEMQAVVAEMIDRFVASQAASQAFSLRVVSVGHPNWRAKAQPLLQPLEVQTPGIQAWLLPKEDAALLVTDLRRRIDFREHSSPHLLVNSGQSTTVASTRNRSYVKEVTLRPDLWPAFEPAMGQFDEGFSLELSPLMSLDGRTIDAVLKCQIDQLEKLVPVMMEVPTPVAPRQRTEIRVPQVVQFQLHERFRWPTDQVLVVGMGVVPTPVPIEAGGLLNSLPGLAPPTRADLLVFIECKGSAEAPPAAPGAAGAVPTAARDARPYRGRY